MQETKKNAPSGPLPNARGPIRFRPLNDSCSAFVAGVGLVALVGWALGLPILAGLGPGKIPVAPSTAVMFVLYAVAVFLRAHLSLHRWAYRTGLVINAAGALFAALLFVLPLLGIRAEAEHLGFAIVHSAGEIPMGHMSPATAFCFIIASLSFLMSLNPSLKQTWRTSAAWLLACLLLLISGVLVLAYLYGEPLLYGSLFIPPALPTSVAFMFLGTSLLDLAGPKFRPLSRQAGPSVAAAYAFVLIFVVLAAGIVTAGYLSYKRYEKGFRSQVERQLSAVADLKVEELSHWRRERLEDASVFYGNANFYERVRLYIEMPGDAEMKERLLTWLRRLQEAYEYDRVSLHDADGRERLSVPSAPGPSDERFSRCVAETLRTGEVSFEDFYRNEHDGRVYLSVLVPILDKGHGSSPIGALAIRIDPEKYLYPFIKRWPTSSPSAETLLVRREGDEAVFLNELRFKKDTALNLRYPLTQTEVPAVQAAMGRKGVIEGRDYRDVAVIADVRPVPDSPWFLVTRMDISEVYHPLKERLWLVVGFVVVLLFGTGAGVGILWRQQSIFFYRQRYEAAEALRESEERFRLLVEGVEDYAIFMLDLSGRVTSWNQGAERIKGYKEEEIIGRNFSCFYSGEDLAQGRPLLEVQEAGRSGRFEVEGWRVRKDGSLFWANVVMTALKDETGQLSGFLKITRDITEHRRSQLERETTIEFLRLVNESAGARALVGAAATFFQKQSGCEAVGIRLHEGEDYPYFEARGFPKEFVLLENSLCAKDSANCILRDSAGNPVIECMCGNVICGRFDPSKEFFTQHGSFWTNSTTQLLASTTEADRQSRTRNRCNGEGYESVALLPLRFGEKRLGLLQLNDRRKGVFSAEAVALWERLADYLAVALAKFRAEEALREREELLLLTGRMARIGGWEFDVGTSKGTWTDEVARIHDLDPEKETNVVLGLSFYKGDSRSKIENAIKEAIDLDKPYDLELELISAKGVHKWVRTIGQPVKEGDKVVKVQGIFQDITERKRAEDEILKLNQELEQRVRQRTIQLEAANKELEGFSYSVSHDLRAPLRHITGFAELLLKKAPANLDEKSRHYLHVISEAATQMGRLVDDLLSFSRMGRAEMLQTRINLDKLVIEAIDTLKTEIRGRDIVWEIGRFPEVYGDPVMLKMVVVNLLSNALKFTRLKTRARIEIGHIPGEPEEEIFYVRDNGAGFDMKFVDKLFGLFQRLHRAEEFDGTGLGLANVRRIIHRHGGRTWAEGAVNEGATVYFSLPKIKED